MQNNRDSQIHGKSNLPLPDTKDSWKWSGGTVYAHRPASILPFAQTAAAEIHRRIADNR